MPYNCIENFVVRRTKKKVDGTVPIEITISVKGKRRYVSTGREVKLYEGRFFKTVFVFFKINSKKNNSIFCEFSISYYLCTQNKTIMVVTFNEDLYPFKSLHFEALHGDKEGRFSIKANDQYRIEFTLEELDEEPVVTICNIMELSNHYK